MNLLICRLWKALYYSALSSNIYCNIFKFLKSNLINQLFQTEDDFSLVDDVFFDEKPPGAPPSGSP